MTTTITRAIVNAARHLYEQVLTPLHIRNLARESDKATAKAERKYQVADRLSEAAGAAYESADVAQAQADEVRQRNANETALLLDRVL